ncbi:GNAT family N-acetyltransferase [Afifella sp. IM 167]|uniref:GNAT family N-acetyltransferase n=1 Tax=Afifella sp. IM 167 TaxID=2033586 RepID=UPI001CCFCA19|nr:GNAT family N-acetyltransferase [Afifella sp. IM 167]MBZ8133714.1 hypothetical protein [Afifella sp. IM 167]
MSTNETTLRTERLCLRPLRMADRPALVETVFSDPLVMKGLFHDASEPHKRDDFARKWCDSLGIDGENAIWSDGGIGAFAVTDASGMFAPKDRPIGIVGFFGMAREAGKWSGELFYALGSAFHGKRVMSEAAAAAVAAFRALPDAGRLYAVYWAHLNPASGRTLRRIGFVDAGTTPLVEEFGRERVESLCGFERWRLSVTPPAEVGLAAREAAIKLGHIAAEGIGSREQALASILEATSHAPPGAVRAEDIGPAFDLGLHTPGLALLTLTADPT